MVGSDLDEKVICKGCVYNGKYILKHLSKMPMCKSLYKEEDITALKKISKIHLDLKRRNDYDKDKRAQRYQEEKEAISLKSHQQKIKKRSKSPETDQMGVVPLESIQTYKTSAIEKHLEFQEEIGKRIANLNYRPQSFNQQFMELDSEIKNLQEKFEEEIRIATSRAKHLRFDIKNTSEVFENLMSNIETEWEKINDKLSCLIEEIPLMSCGLKLYGES